MNNQTQNLPAVDDASTSTRDQQAVIQALDSLKRCQKLLARIYDMMNHTPTSEDGERVFAGIEDAGELYTILYLAVTGGPEYLKTLEENMEGEDRATSDAGLVRVTGRNDEEFETERAEVEGEILIATDWT